jgi:DNA modification methylase
LFGWHSFGIGEALFLSSLAMPASRSNTRSTPVSVSYRVINELKPDPRNARLHSKAQIRQLAASIEAFGFNVPILVDAQDNVLAGHARLLACKQLGYTQVPIIRLEHLSAAQARAFQLADNRLAEIAVWDERLLGEQLKELSELNLDFSLELTGFSMGEIDFRIERLSAPAEQAAPDPDDIAPAAATVAVTRPGDLWLLGAHRLLCADAQEPSSYTRLMQGSLAKVVFSDPPYNVPIHGHVSGKGAIVHREFAMASGELSEQEFVEFLRRVLALLARFSVSGSIHFICMDWRHAEALLVAARAVYSELKNLCVWVKDRAGMGSLYRSQHELVFVFKSGAAPHRNNVQLGSHGRDRTNVWHYPGIHTLREGEEGDVLTLHPTCKPVKMVADALLDCSKRNDVVLDAFLGSGTTLIAAERVGRVCYGIEIDPLYVDVAIRRWQSHSGAIARLAETEESFAQREAQASTQPRSCPHEQA